MPRMSLILLEKLEKKVEQYGSGLSTISRDVNVGLLGSKINSLDDNFPLLHLAEDITLSQQRQSPDMQVSSARVA